MIGGVLFLAGGKTEDDVQEMLGQAGGIRLLGRSLESFEFIRDKDIFEVEDNSGPSVSGCFPVLHKVKSYSHKATFVNEKYCVMRDGMYSLHQ